MDEALRIGRDVFLALALGSVLAFVLCVVGVL